MACYAGAVRMQAAMTCCLVGSASWAGGHTAQGAAVQGPPVPLRHADIVQLAAGGCRASIMWRLTAAVITHDAALHPALILRLMQQAADDTA